MVPPHVGPPRMTLRALAFAAILLACLPREALAQCATKVSSCTQCHEIEGRAPVHGDASPWHEDHALGDFCVGCHGGAPEADHEAEAHVGLIPPLADVARSCAPCHADGLALALRYAGHAAAREAGSARAPAPRPASARNGLVGALAVATAIAGGTLVAITERRRRAIARGGSFT